MLTLETVNLYMPLLIPAIAAVLVAFISGLFAARNGRRQSKTDGFKAVTDQLFKLNEELNGRIDDLEGDINSLKAELERKEKEIDEQLSVARQLARYIKKLLGAWPTDAEAPPMPDPPFDWERHL